MMPLIQFFHRGYIRPFVQSLNTFGYSGVRWLHYILKNLALVTMKTKVQMKVLFWTVANCVKAMDFF